MAYYLKPLTYNSQVVGYLVRIFPGPWTVLSARDATVLGTFTDDEILVENTNTPDLRPAVRLVQQETDRLALEQRAQLS